MEAAFAAFAAFEALLTDFAISEACSGLLIYCSAILSIALSTSSNSSVLFPAASQYLLESSDFLSALFLEDADLSEALSPNFFEDGLLSFIASLPVLLVFVFLVSVVLPLEESFVPVGLFDDSFVSVGLFDESPVFVLPLSELFASVGFVTESPVVFLFSFPTSFVSVLLEVLLEVFPEVLLFDVEPPPEFELLKNLSNVSAKSAACFFSSYDILL